MTTVPEIGKHSEAARATSARSDMTPRATMPLLEMSRARRKLSELDGPAGLPLVGNVFGIDVERIHLQLEHWARLYGPLYRLNVAGRQVMVVADAKISEQLLRARPKSLRRVGPLERVFVEMGTAGVFSAEGDAWRAQRRLAMQALSNRHLSTFFPTLQRVVLSLRERWGRHVASGESVDIDDDFMRFTVDVTTNLVFGTDLQTLDRGESELHGHLARVFPAFTRRILATLPYWRWVRLPADLALDRSLSAVRKVQEGLVGNARERLAARPPDTEPRDFIEAMLLARDDDGEPFSDEVVYGNMMTMLLAGEDTTAHTLAWAVHLLCDAPQVVARMRSEIDAVLGREPVPTSLESAQDLPYLDAVASETMRLRSVAPLLALEAIEDLVVGDVLVPKGTWIDIAMRAPAISPENFGEPDAFQPERWLEPRPGVAHVPGASLPFGSGPRICPGRTLALVEMRVVLATLLKSFDFERVGAPSDVREHFAFTMAPRGLRVKLRPRA